MGIAHRNRMSRDVRFQFSKNLVEAWYPYQGCQNREIRPIFNEFFSTRKQLAQRKVIKIIKI